MPCPCGAGMQLYRCDSPLTHLPLDKMAANFADDIFNRICFNENMWILIKISLKFIPKSPIDNKLALVRLMAWRRTGDKPLPEPELTQFIYAHMQHQSMMS